jgi:hypothetical protein
LAVRSTVPGGTFRNRRAPRAGRPRSPRADDMRSRSPTRPRAVGRSSAWSVSARQHSPQARARLIRS